jgi:exo-beta-1,3-glucanase (GH17 family)
MAAGSLCSAADHDVEVIKALEAVGIKHLTVAIPNSELAQLAAAVGFGESVAAQLRGFVQAGMQLTIAIGNEPLAPWYNNAYGAQLLPSLRNMRAALSRSGLQNVRLTVPMDLGIVGVSYPPLAGAFKPEFVGMVNSIARLLKDEGSSFMINVYPFFSHKDVAEVSLAYALGETGAAIQGSQYSSLLHVQVSAVRAALLRLDPLFTDANLPIVVGETGWPTAGHPSATPENAAKFLKNVFRSGLAVFLFEAFDEQKKSMDSGAGAEGAVVENNWGLLTEGGVVKYSLEPCGLGALAATALPSPARIPSPTASSPVIDGACKAAAEWMLAGGCAQAASYYAGLGLANCSSRCAVVTYLSDREGKCSPVQKDAACAGSERRLLDLEIRPDEDRQASSCADLHLKCSQWASACAATKIGKWVQLNCPRSCGLCVKGPTAGAVLLSAAMLLSTQ